MSSRLQELYHTDCKHCRHQPESLTLGVGKNKLQGYLKAVAKAVKQLHKKGGYSPDDLKNTKAYQNLISATFDIFDTSITDGELPTPMKDAFRYNTFLFAGLKTHAHLFEAASLLTAKGQIKPFEVWHSEVAKVSNRHKHWLEAEYDFAVGSVQMAERWHRFKPGDRYLLQYRTANDDRVRVSHRPLHNTTLPKSDPFWDKYFPPNGWRCRCTTVQVLKDDYPVSDSKEARKKGQIATTYINRSGKNKLEMFRFNAGKNRRIFPDKHPYNKVKGADKVKQNLILTIMEYKPLGFVLHKKFKTGGSVYIHKDIDKNASDYKALVESAEHFAKEMKETAVLMPKIHRKDSRYEILYKELIGTKFEGKCPDLKIGHIFYEHEGFTGKNPKKSLRNMLNRGQKQSAYLIIDDCGVTEKYLKRNIGSRIAVNKQDIKEVWIKKGNSLKLLYKNAETR